MADCFDTGISSNPNARLKYESAFNPLPSYGASRGSSATGEFLHTHLRGWDTYLASDGEGDRTETEIFSSSPSWTISLLSCCLLSIKVLFAYALELLAALHARRCRRTDETVYYVCI